MSAGVKVVGGSSPTELEVPEEVPASPEVPVSPEEAPDFEAASPKERPELAPGGRKAHPDRRRGSIRGRRLFVVVSIVAVVGVAGTVGFGLAWGNLNAQRSGEAQARSAASAFLTDLTNFSAKSIDADFTSITNMATGSFATQADKFFGSSIRQELETALATSRGQIRDSYVESYGGGQASVYAVVDQLYANDKISTPQSDVLRIVVNLTQRSGSWKVSNVTVLEGPSLSSGSTGSSTGTSTGGG